MNFKKKNTLPAHLREDRGLPRSHEERLMWIKQRVEEGYYDGEKIKRAVVDAFMDPPDLRRAGDQALATGQGGE